MNPTRCQPSSIRLVDNVQLKAGQFFRPDPGYLELLTDGLKKLYVTKILGFRDDEMCAATVLFEGDPEDVKNNEDKIYSIAKRYGGIPAGESNGRRGYMLTYIIAYIRDFACDYYFIGDSFETSVPWDKTVLLCINVKKRLTRECTGTGFSCPGDNPFLAFGLHNFTSVPV
ncbi:alkyldihydroxyacetonephosphate synthase, peroxisomal-like [Diaphorina citri]|uniref:Alkylglycerone-phosphate synthase n=1 Tax=Diaphorina citri TaxID=121845 RepID=A0A1S3D4U0_DIACI|nr:alkyldihydroxyacetonephosphate synthase, peroxisomal-like [Diaphorina citri]